MPFSPLVYKIYFDRFLNNTVSFMIDQWYADSKNLNYDKNT